MVFYPFHSESAFSLVSLCIILDRPSLPQSNFGWRIFSRQGYERNWIQSDWWSWRWWRRWWWLLWWTMTVEVFFFCLFYIEKPIFWMPLMNVVVFYIYKWFLHFFVLFLVSCSRFFLHFLKVFHFLCFFSFFSSFYLFQLTLCDDLFFLFWILIIIIFSFTTYIL